MAYPVVDHRVLITGAGSGLGAALAEAFVAEGAHVALVDVDLDRVRAVAAELDPEHTLALAADVRSPQSLHGAVEKAIERFGRLDAVIPNAGIWDYNRSITRLGGEEIAAIFDEVIAVNAKGYLLTAEATWRHLLATRGSLVMTLSNAAFYAAGGGPAYTASKFAARGLVTELAYELAPKVRVNGVAVGGMRTNLSGPAAGGLEERSIAEVYDRRPSGGNPYLPLHDISIDPGAFVAPYLMLASHTAGANMTGTIINIDGGISARGFALAAGGDDL